METCENVNESLTSVQNLVTAQRTARMQLQVVKLNSLAKIIARNVAFLSTGNSTEIYDELEEIKILSKIIDDLTVSAQFLLNFYIREKRHILEKNKKELEKSGKCEDKLVQLTLIIDKIDKTLCKFPKIKLTCTQYEIVSDELQSEIQLLFKQPRTPENAQEISYTSKYLKFLKYKYKKCNPCKCK